MKYPAIDQLVAERVMGWPVIPATQTDPNLTTDALASKMMHINLPLGIGARVRELVKGEAMCSEVFIEGNRRWINEVGLEVAQHRLGLANEARIDHPTGEYDWSPTSDWSATGEVMDKMTGTTNSGGSAERKWELAGFDDGECIARFNEAEPWHSFDTKLAICLAALAAVGVPQAEIDAAMKETSNG